MIIHECMPVNLATVGVKRRGHKNEADLDTIMRTSHPVLSAYWQLCIAAKLKPYAGGTYLIQGPSNIPGYCTSGFRDKVIQGNGTSPHLWGFALDVAVGDVARQMEVAALALDYFVRVGIYPANGFIHVDQAPEIWIATYGKARVWMKDKSRGIDESFGGPEAWSSLVKSAKDSYGI